MSRTAGATQLSGRANESAPDRNPSSYAWTAHLVAPEAVRRAYQKIVSSDKYQTHAAFRSHLDAGMEEQFPGLVLQLQPETDEALVAARRFARLTSIQKAFRGAIVLSSLGGIAATVEFLRPGGLLSSSTGYELPFILMIFLVVVTLTSLWPTLSRRSKQARDQRRLAVGKHSVKMRSLVQDSFTLVLNETLGPEKELTFPTVAPRLVELSASKVVSSSSSVLLKDFISGHESSAIGIAGPRGSGKSTMMRGLKRICHGTHLLFP